MEFKKRKLLPESFDFQAKLSMALLIGIPMMAIVTCVILGIVLTETDFSTAQNESYSFKDRKPKSLPTKEYTSHGRGINT